MRTPTLFAGLALSIAVMAGTPPTPAMLENLASVPAAFEENKGQVRTTDGAAAPDVRYRLSQGNTHIFLLESGIAYQFSRKHLPAGYAELMAAARGDASKLKELDALREQIKLETYRMDMVLEGGDPHARISAEGKSEDYTQYYNHDALDVHSYTKVTYHEVYPGIDWVVYTTAKGMKYDFVVRPSADPQQIRLRFKDHEELSVDAEGNLIHGNRMGQFTEERPVSFQDGKEVPTSFVLEGNALRFALEDYDHSRTLIIDPARLWGTYYGGTGWDYGWSCTVDASSNVYMAGFTESTSAIAAGGHQNTLGGATDAFLVKFNSSGTRLWSTYYGGDDHDLAFHCATDANGNVFLAGTTHSLAGISSGGHQNTHAGSDDGFLVKFNASGTRLWATYYGGPSSDRGFHCAVDPSGNVFLSGETVSTTGIAASGHQSTFGGGDDDGFLVKFSPSGTRLWGTYYGGSGLDTGEAGGVDANGNVYIAGWTTSSANIASGGHQGAYAGGGGDAYLAKFTASGTREWGTYYGSGAYDRGFRCGVEANGNVFLIGETQSTTAIAAGGFQNTYGGGSADAFIAKFSTTGTRLWGSYYGGSGLELGYSCVVDANGNSFLAGYTASTSDIASNGHQNTFGGGSADAFLVKFGPSGNRLWGTYYGGTGIEGGPHGGFYTNSTVQCAVDPSGNAYLSGTTDSNSGIQSGGHQSTIGGDFDAFLVKFEDRSIATGVINGPICTGQAVSVPFTVSGAFNAGNTFTAQLSNASGSFTSPVSLGTLSGTTSGTINASIPLGTTPGAGYRIRVVGSNPIVEGTDNGTNLTINDRTTNCTCADVVETEANNTAATANASAYDTPVSGITGPCSLPDNTADHFGFTTTTQGVLHVEACLSNSGPTALDVTFRVLNSSGTTLGTFTLPAGANNTPVSGEFEFPCLGIGAYRIAVDNPSTTVCTNYSFSYTMLPPVFANDPEPNDGLGVSATQVAYNTDQDGRNNFNGETTYDYYRILLPTNGVLNIDVQAEHAGATPGTLTVALLNNGGSVLQTWPVAVGANSVPVSSSMSITCRSTVSNYHIRINSAVCGTSYRFKYTVTQPLFAGDIEPNNGTPGTSAAHDTYMDGNLQFDGESTYDYYNIVPPINGVMNIEVQAEHVGGTPGNIDLVLYTTAGITIQTWSIPVGANSTATTTTVSIPCRSLTTDYDLRFATTTCGVSYRWKCTMTPALFANDAEPNETYGGSTEAHNTWYEGQLGFDNQTEDDIYNLVPPFNGVMNIEVEAEHVGASPGTLNVALVTTAGIIIQTWTMTAGASGVPHSTLVSVPCRSSTTDYDLRFSDVTCGVSYRWKYTMSAPLFANDAEPNQVFGGSTEADSTWYEGQIGFDNQTDDDIYNIVPAHNGVMHIEVEAEHTGASPGTVEVELFTTSGTSIQLWTVTVGANGIPVSTSMSVPCRSFTTDYDLRFRDVTCGVSYRWKYTMTTPLFAIDAEPNETYGGSTEADSTWYEGQVGFDNQTDDDVYNLVPATNGVMNIEVQAEHTGTSPGTVTVTLLTTAGSTIQSWTMVVGANGVAHATLVSVPCRSNITDYDLRFSDVTCGVSYRWKYTMTPPAFAADVEPNNGTPGTPLAHDTYAEGNLAFDAESTYDYYRIVPAFNGMVNVELQAEHTGAVPGTITVLLLNTAGSTLQTWSFPVGANSVPITTTLSRTCLNGGTGYDLRLASSVCGASYKLKYTLTPAVFTSDTEPNNSTSQAIILPETQTTQGQLNFPSGDNNDTYRANLSGDGILNVTIEAEHAGIETNAIMTVQLYISTGTVLQTWTAPIGASATSISTVLSKTCLGNTGNYYLQLSSSICGTSYRISYSVTPPVFTQDVEPNNSTGQAILLTPVQPKQGHLNFYFGDNTDHYRANIPTDGVLNLNIEAEHTGTDPNALVTIQLYVSTGTVLQTWTAPVGAGSVAISTALSKTCLGLTVPYYLSFTSSVCGTSYRITYTVTPPVFANDNEANDGGGLAHDTYAEGHLEFYNLGPYDYYNIVPPVNGVMTFEVQAEHVGAVADSMQLRLINTTASTIQFWNIPVGANGVPVTSTFSIPCRGNTTDYDVRLSSYACGTSYKWKYTMTAPFFAPDVEPNNQTPGGVGSPVAHDTYQTGHVEFHSQTDHDLYNIVAPSNGTMIFTVDAEHAGAVADSMELRLYTSAGITIQFWTIPVGANGVPVTSTFSIPCRTSTTDYDVRITSHACGTSYRWKYTMAAPVFANDVESNGSTSSAIVLPQATPMTGQLNFGGGENNDYYRINILADGVLHVTIEAEHAGASSIETIAARISLSTSTTLATWNAAVGASGTPASTSFSLSCRGTTVTYYLNLSSNVCGASYRVSWTITEPVYANDPEPNNSGAGTPMNLNVAGQQGHIGFYNTTDNDYYGFMHPGGPWSVTISAEHVNAGEGSMVLEVRNSASTLFGSFTVPVGGSSTSLTNTFTLPSLSAGSLYRMILKDVTCGVSYRIHCYDADGDGTCNAADVCAGGPEPGMPCNDNNSGTINDTVQPDCQCEGTLLGADCNGVPGGPALPGTACNDNNTCTINDVLDANCLCAGTFADADADGTCDANDLCPGGPEPGTACNDNNGATINDIIQSNCQCVGTLLGSDCNGVPGGPAGPGTACNDNNLCTVNDVFDANCLCAGTFADGDADGTCDANDACPGGPEPGTTCNDNNACTTGDVIGSNCLCAGTFADADGDGTCDANDLCAGGPEPGTACNDNNACTTGDVIGSNCLCAGTVADADGDGTCDANDL
nr:hypothetical protein [Flavobacteriales bacterium]